jgi:hypothetical protein
MTIRALPPLYSFAFHPRGAWLKELASVAKPEPWGNELKVLELYVRSNFEIAKLQSKVVEDKANNLAFWRPGYLVNATSDPIWLIYQRNSRDSPYWKIEKITTGDAPQGEVSQFTVKYEPPEFHSDWLIHFDQWSITHIMGDSRNRKRLEEVFSSALGGCFNDHFIFRAIYGELQLKRKEEVVISEWYHGDYHFLMPLFLTQADHVELTAVLRPDPTLKRYVVKTLLLPNFAYAYARALVKSRASFADWMMLSEDELNKAAVDTDDEAEE